MDDGLSSGCEQRLSDLKERFESWRLTKTNRGEAIPDALWSEVIELSQVLPHGRLCRVLRLGSHDLKKRLGLPVARAKRPRRKVSLVDMTEAVSSAVLSSASAEMTIERGDGARLRLSYSGSVGELGPLVTEFLRSP